MYNFDHKTVFWISVRIYPSLMLTPQCALHTQTKIGALGQKKRLHWWFWKALNFYTTSDFDSFTFYIVPAECWRYRDQMRTHFDANSGHSGIPLMFIFDKISYDSVKFGYFSCKNGVKIRILSNILVLKKSSTFK